MSDRGKAISGGPRCRSVVHAGGYERVRDRMTREEFDRRVRETIDEWGGLLDSHAAAMLMLEKAGVDVAEWTPLAELEDNAEVSVRGSISEVGPVREFERRDGSRGRVVNATLRDSTGSCRLTLWDDDVDLVASGKIRVGSAVRVLDGYVRRTRYGLEIGRGKFGSVVVG